ncbi:MAG: hypothetical protein DMG53_13240 [Acidobacteria bacterium]|nr:MAG: hypothetical protein DMG53_13240 [Acidobacteriota bacterium]
MPDTRLVSVWRQQHTVRREARAHAICISLEPSFFVLAVHSLYLCSVFLGQAASGVPDHGTNQRQRNQWQYLANVHEASLVGGIETVPVPPLAQKKSRATKTGPPTENFAVTDPSRRFSTSIAPWISGGVQHQSLAAILAIR